MVDRVSGNAQVSDESLARLAAAACSQYRRCVWTRSLYMLLVYMRVHGEADVCIGSFQSALASHLS